jgi:hypothetical protein
MTELIERYVHQVGRYLPPDERAEIEAELRSQIQDQLDDRYGESPSQEEVASVLAEFGHPYQIAASYSSEQYLVGPMFYPYMALVMRYGWIIIPAIVIFLNIFGALTSSRQITLFDLFMETLVGVVQAALMFFAVVVLIFAIIERISAELQKEREAFNPLNLPEVDDPGVVDRVEEAFGLAFGMVMALVFIYFLRVGGLTLRFNLTDPGEVIAVPTLWLVLLIVDILAQLIVNVLVLLRNRWSVGLMLTQAVLEVFGMICLYFVVFLPLFTHINPQLADVAQIIVIVITVISLLNRGSKLVGLLNYQKASPLKVKNG